MSSNGTPLSTTDARKQSPKVRRRRRQEAARLHAAGMPVMEIVRATGLSWPTVNSVIGLLRSGSDPAPETAAKGRKKGSGRKLTPQQEGQIQRLLRRTPRGCGLQGQLWSRGAVQQLVEKATGVRLTRRGIGNYLADWGIDGGGTNTKPEVHCSGPVKAWLTANYEGLHQQARNSRAEIYWLHTPARLDLSRWYSPTSPAELKTESETDRWVESDADPDGELEVDPVAETPVTRRSKRVSVLSVSNNQGKRFWRLVPGSVTAQRQTQFLRALLKGTRSKTIFLIRPDRRAWPNATAPRVTLFPQQGP